MLRGYDPGAFRGRTYILNNLEYRFPIYDPDRGISTLPFYGSRIAGNLFLDYGGAFDALDFDDIRFFDQGDIIKADQLHTGFGAEIWLSLIIGYAAGLDMRIGYAYGPNPNAIPGGKGYFLAATAF